jgi:hypothetical protein
MAKKPITFPAATKLKNILSDVSQERLKIVIVKEHTLFCD